MSIRKASIEVHYTVSDKAGNEAHEIRTVSVTFVVVDTISPEIFLNGSDFIRITQGDSYIEPGATADDNVDGDITDNIVIGGDIVDTDVPKTYKITYNVSLPSHRITKLLTMWLVKRHVLVCK